MKYLISITGPSTVGKTTLVLTIKSLTDGSQISIIPQTTCRKPREDDDPSMIRVVSKERFRISKFFVAHGNYGILMNDFLGFLHSKDFNIAVCINGANEIEQIPISGKVADVEFRRINILLRFSNDFEEEIKTIGEKIPKFFSSEWQAKSRISSNQDLTKNKFFSREFLNANIDLILTRNENIESWIKKIEEKVGIKLGKVENSVPNSKTKTREIMPLNNPNPIILSRF